MAEEREEDIQLDPELIAKVEDTPEEEPQKAQAQEPETDIPDKYRGKDPMDLIRMHQDAERLIGKHSNEVGELRQVVNDILAAQTAQPSRAPEPEEEVNWFEDPDKATESRFRKYSEPMKSELDQVKQKLSEYDHREAARALIHRHPDAQEVAGSPEFRAWVDNSKVRQRMYTQANQGFDHEVASELLDLWKERQQTNQVASSTAKAQRTQSVRNASTGGAKAGGGDPRKPILSREAIVELKRKDPEKYARMLPQIKQAYLEGRYTT